MRRPVGMPTPTLQQILDWWASSVQLMPGVRLHRSARTASEAKKKLYAAWRRMHRTRHEGNSGMLAREEP